MKLTEARTQALLVQEALFPHCEKCEIAGSIRREKSEVKDIEIVCIPLPFEIGLFETGFAQAVNKWEKVKGDPTGKYTQRRLPSGIMLDIFIAGKDNFGYIFMLRTGSSDWNQRVMLPRLKGNGYRMSEGNIWHKGAIVSVTTYYLILI